jgi:competence protein ComEC
MQSTRHAALDTIERTYRSKPLVFVACAWILGIWLADMSAVTPTHLALIGLLLGLAALGCRVRWLALGLLMLAVVSLGAAAARLALTPPRGDISERAGQQIAVLGTITDDPTERCDHWHFFLDCHTVCVSSRCSSVCGRLSVATSQDLSHIEAGSSVWVYGVLEVPSPARNPGGFSAATWAVRHGAFAIMSARPGAVVSIPQPGWSWRRWFARQRNKIANANVSAMTDREAARLVNSILFGASDQEDSQIRSELEERFKRAGVYHELVVSGAQIALLFGLLYLWRHWVLRPRAAEPHWRSLRWTGGYSVRWALGGGLILVAPYVLLVGLQPSVLRAAIVAVLYFTARCLDREIDPENTLAAAALLLLVPNPLTLYDTGFQFSFAAVWGILRGSPPLARALSPSTWRGQTGANGEMGMVEPHAFRPGWFVWVVSASLAAQLATAPLQAHYFQTLSLIGPISNPPIELMVSALLPLGLVTSAVTAPLSGLLPQALTPLQFLHGPSQGLAWLIGLSVTGFAALPAATITVFPPCWVVAGLYWTLLLVSTCPVSIRLRGVTLLLMVAGAAVLCLGMFLPAPAAALPTLTFIDVGQGDACLVRLPGGATMLVDGGGSPRAPCATKDCSDPAPGHLAEALRPDCTDVGRDILASYLRHEHIHRLDLVVVTHPHDDHLWGLDAILDSRQGFKVGAVLDAERPFTSVANHEWPRLLQQQNVTPILAQRGMQLALGSARLDVLSPPHPFLSHTRNDENNNSVVLRLDVGGSRVLLTGDTEAEAEAAMGDQDVRADVLKVGHHGSAYSSSDTWLDRVQPKIAVISCGRHNSFGHPSLETLARLQRHHVRTYRTDQDGAVTLELRARGWIATTMVGTRRR